jgi:hypothetical protein
MPPWQELVAMAEGSKLVGTMQLLDSYDDMIRSVRSGYQEEVAEQARLVNILQVGPTQLPGRCRAGAGQVPARDAWTRQMCCGFTHRQVRAG